MFRLLFPIIISAFLALSCQPEGRVYAEHQDLSPEIEWLKKDVRTFSMPIKNDTTLYNLGLTFRYASGYQYQIAKIKVTEKSPSGKESISEYSLKIRTDKGEYIGEPGYDIWDSEHTIQSNKKYEELGIYTYKIEHIMPHDPLNFAMEIGVVLDEVN